jgi:outer membrane biosynthesis protein TonB
MRRGLTISVVAHAVALGFGLIAISAAPMESPPVDSLPVSFISDKDFSQMTQGVKNAPKPKVEQPKPLADKIDMPKPVDQIADKVGKQDITTETAPPKQQPQPDPKPAEKQAKPKPPDDFKPDQISQLLKKDSSKQQPKPPDKPVPDKATKDAPKFNADQVASLLDHREPQRQMASADAVNQTPSAGSATGAAAQLSQSEIDALRARISSCWSPPPGVDAKSKVYIVLDVQFRPDANMAREPLVVEGSASSLGPALAESAKRALLLCQPFTMLRPEHYDQWKDIQLKFDPQELLGG